MKIVPTKSHGVMTIDEDLREVASDLIDQYPGELGHIVLDRVVFIRSESVKLKKKNNWLGKCFFIRPEIRIIINNSILRLCNLGMVDKDQLVGLEDMLCDIRYMIVLNDVAIDDIGVDKKRMERIVLHHELLHIDPSMDGNVQHDIQDFAWIIDRYGSHWTQGILPEDGEGKPDFASDLINSLKEKGIRMNMPMGVDFEEVE